MFRPTGAFTTLSNRRQPLLSLISNDRPLSWPNVADKAL
jgi:hypothetical protein